VVHVHYRPQTIRSVKETVEEVILSYRALSPPGRGHSLYGLGETTLVLQNLRQNFDERFSSVLAD
jgi:hypothetical protein